MDDFVLGIAPILAFFVILILISVFRGWLRRVARPAARVRPRLMHAINDDRCTGCEACVSACPTDVLALVQNKSRVERIHDCIQCEQCALVCPTTALVMFPQGTEPPPYRMPELDEYYQAAEHLYLIGEAAGKPLVKNASNLGRAVIEHMVQNGLRPQARGRGDVDVLIVGSGPGGLSAALSCIAHGLRYVVLEKDETVASTIAHYPKGKHVMAEPYDVRCVGLLPVWDADKAELVQAWRTLLEERGVAVSTREAVETIARAPDGRFDVTTSRAQYRAARVVLAIGTRGKPRRLGVPGEDLSKVAALLDDPENHRGERVLVVGGGDSAVEAAIALAATAKSVTLSYRGKALSRCKAANRQKLQVLSDEGKVTLAFGTTVSQIEPHTVMLKSQGGDKSIGNDYVVVCIGGDAPLKWLQSVGVRFADKPHLFQLGPTDQLVESLIGPQPETTRDGRAAAAPQPVATELEWGDDDSGATIVYSRKPRRRRGAPKERLRVQLIISPEEGP